MDHPSQGIADGSGYKEREQRVSGSVTGHKTLAFTNIPLSLGVALACLPYIVLALAVQMSGGLRGTIGNIM
jgi:hypothetical protein